MSNSPFVPTEDQIRHACEEIQKTWSDEERAKRRLGSAAAAKLIRHWTAPLYNSTELATQFRHATRERASA
jgi:hypothetical protein